MNARREKRAAKRRRRERRYRLDPWGRKYQFVRIYRIRGMANNGSVLPGTIGQHYLDGEIAADDYIYFGRPADNHGNC